VVTERPSGQKPPVMSIHRSATKAMRLFNADRLSWMEKAAELGPLVSVQAGPVRLTFVLSDPDGCRSVLITDSSSWQRPWITTVPLRVAGGESLLTQKNSDWAQVQPCLAPDFRKRVLQTRLDELEDLIDHEIAALPLHQSIDFDQVLGRLTMTIAARVLFSQHLERDRADELIYHQRALIDWLGNGVTSLAAQSPAVWVRSAKAMRQHRRALFRYAAELIEERRRRTHTEGDVLDSLLAARSKGQAVTEAQLQGHVLGLLGAGNETTAAALGWAVVRGASHPEEWAGLRSDSSAVPDYIAETLRLSPPAWSFLRAPTRSGAFIPIGQYRYGVSRFQSIAVNIWGMNRDPKTWPDPTSFQPSRHRQLTTAQERAMLPFGLGPRSCIGQHLALAEMRTVLPAIARHGDVLVDGAPVEDPHFTLRVQGGLRGRFVPQSVRKVPRGDSP